MTGSFSFSKLFYLGFRAFLYSVDFILKNTFNDKQYAQDLFIIAQSSSVRVGYFIHHTTTKAKASFLTVCDAANSPYHAAALQPKMQDYDQNAWYALTHVLPRTV